MKPAQRIIAALTVILLVMPLLSGCGDDAISPQDRLAGTWNCTKYEITYSDGVIFDFLDTVDSFTLTFSKDGNYTAVISQGGIVTDTSTGQYSATGNRITFDPGLSDFTLNYSISGDVLVMFGTVTGEDYDTRFVKA